MSDEQELKDFPYPIGEEVEEEVPVQRISVDEIDELSGKAKFSIKTEMRKQKVKYIHVPKNKLRCKPGEHIFRPLNTKKGIFGCTQCPYSMRVFPTHYKFVPTDDSGMLGKLVQRSTNKVV